MTVHALAPASTANLGPAFDCAAAALELWNEVVVDESDGGAVEIEGEGAAELPRDASHLTLRAFALFAPPERYRFRFVNRIPLERGLGSSAAAIALGLVAGSAVAGRSADPGELLPHAVRLEGHADNVAAALLGGVCVAWWNGGDVRAARIADDLPLASVLAVPAARTSTAQSRNGLPETVTHADAAANAGFAALLGAAVASGDAELLRAAFNDRLHEQYRAGDAPLLGGDPRERDRRRGRRDAVRLRPVRRRLGRARPRSRRRCPAARDAVRRHPGAPAASGPERSQARMTPYGKTHPAKRNSAALTDGVDRAPARAMLKGAGFTDADLARPLIGVATTWIETMPCNLNQRVLARYVKQGIRQAGGTPLEFNTIAVSDGVTMGAAGMRASLVSREVIADSIELVDPRAPLRRARLPRRLRQDDPRRSDGARAPRHPRARLLRRVDRSRPLPRART